MSPPDLACITVLSCNVGQQTLLFKKKTLLVPLSPFLDSPGNEDATRAHSVQQQAACLPLPVADATKSQTGHQDTWPSTLSPQLQASLVEEPPSGQHLAAAQRQVAALPDVETLTSLLSLLLLLLHYPQAQMQGRSAREASRQKPTSPSRNSKTDQDTAAAAAHLDIHGEAVAPVVVAAAAAAVAAASGATRQSPRCQNWIPNPRKSPLPERADLVSRAWSMGSKGPEPDSSRPRPRRALCQSQPMMVSRMGRQTQQKQKSPSLQCSEARHRPEKVDWFARKALVVILAQCRRLPERFLELHCC